MRSLPCIITLTAGCALTLSAAGPAGAQPSVVSAEIQIDDGPVQEMTVLPDSQTTVPNPGPEGPARAWSQTGFTFDLDTSALSIGPHTLSIRVEDSQGQFSEPWSGIPFSQGGVRSSQIFRVEGDEHLTGAEYLFTGVPGERLTAEDLALLTPTPIQTPGDGNWADGLTEALSFPIDTTTLDPGDYYVYMRSIDQDGNASFWGEGTFSVAPELSIQGGEIVGAPDAPIGSGIPLTINPEGDAPDGEIPLISEPVDLFDYSQFPQGERPTLHVRAQDNLNFHIVYTGEIQEPAPDGRGRWDVVPREGEPAVWPAASTVQVNRCPFAESQLPAAETIRAVPGQRFTFEVTPMDADGDPGLEVTYLINGEQQSSESLAPGESSSLDYTLLTFGPGNQIIVQAEISDGTAECIDTVQWTLTPLITPEGSWSVSGNDTQNWVADLELVTGEEQPDGTFLLNGDFEWNSTDYTQYGREVVQGTFDPETLVVVLTGVQLINANGLGLGTYAATMSADGRELLNGTWTGVPGTWSATRTGEVTSRFTEDLEGWRSQE